MDNFLALNHPSPDVERLPIQSNSGREYRFIPGINHITGEKGWVPQDIPGFDPVPAVMVVHDLMEHFPGDEYEPHNEYQAQGAMFWLRHEGGYFGAKRTAVAVVPPAFGMLFTHIIEKGLSTKPCPVVPAAHAHIGSEESVKSPFLTDVEMQATIQAARNYLTGEEIDGQKYKFPNNTTKSDDRFVEKQKERINDSLHHALGWMRIGFRRAALRYKGYDKYRLVSLFRRTQEEIDRYGQAASTFSVLRVRLELDSYGASVSMASAVTT